MHKNIHIKWNNPCRHKIRGRAALKGTPIMKKQAYFNTRKIREIYVTDTRAQQSPRDCPHSKRNNGINTTLDGTHNVGLLVGCLIYR